MFRIPLLIFFQISKYELIVTFGPVIKFLGIKMQKAEKLGYKSLERPENNGLVLGTNHKIATDLANGMIQKVGNK